GNAGKPNLIASFTVDSKKDLPKAKFVVSNDTTKIGIVVTKDNDDNKEMAEAYVAVFDNNAEKLWNKKYNFKVSEKQFSVIDFDLLNNAEFLVLTKIYDNNSQKEEKRGSGKNEPAYDYFLNYFSKDSNEPRKLKLDLKGDFIMGGSLETTPASETYLFGFYSKKAGGIIQGMYNMKVASNGTVEYLNKKEFTDKELSVFEDKDVEKERGDKGISKFYEFTGFKIRKDGTMSIAAEDNYVQTTTTNKVTSYTYFSKSIIDIQMDDKGKISSFRIIPKKQATLNWRLGIGHETVNNENNTYYFYNEDEDNLKKPIEERGQAIKNFKQFVMVMTYFDPATGKPVRKALLDKDKVNQTLEPEHCVQIGDNTLFIVLVEHSNFSVSGTISSVLGKTLRLGTITVSE
ncbi:MAG: hypothetical protein KDD49_02845, partial [Bacteroidetes bacterium]|nr:hypothetical protein [Bacteroidota bacterium]